MPKNRELRGIRRHGRTYQLNIQRGGKRVWINLETDDIKEAIQRAAAIRCDPRRVNATPFEGALARFIAAKGARGRFTARTKEWSLTACRRFAGDCGIAAVSEIGHGTVQRWVERLRGQIKPNSVRSYVRALASFCSWCVREKLLHSNPCENLELPRVPRHGRVLWVPVDLRDRLIAEAPSTELRTMLVLGFFCGLRLNEILEARRDWIDGVRRELEVRPTPTFQPKDSDIRSIPLVPSALKALHPLPNAPDAFLVRPDVPHGAWRYRWDPRRPWADYMRKQGCEWVTPHVMRHTFASILIQQNVSLYKVAKWMGDGAAVVERHYAHLAHGDRDIEALVA